MTVLVDYVRALTPPVAIGFVFYRIIRSMLEADRRERRALARWEAEQGADAARNHHQARTAQRTM